MSSRLPDQLTERTLVVTMALVIVPATQLALVLAATWLCLWALPLISIALVCGALFLDALTRIRQPHRPWAWADLVLGLVVVSAGAVGWVMAWRASAGDMDTNRLIVFALAALWLLAVGIATASIARSLVAPRSNALPPPPPPPPPSLAPLLPPPPAG